MKGKVGLVVLAGLWAFACKRRETPAAPPQSDAGEIRSIAPRPSAAVLRVQYALADGGWDTIGEPSGTAVIEPTQKMQLLSDVPLQNYRIRVLDETERVVPSDDEVQSESSLVYLIAFPTPLKPGHRYALVVDAQTGPAFLDKNGHPQPDQRIELQISGPREKAPPVPSPHRRRHR